MSDPEMGRCTCGEMYLDVLGRFTDLDPERVALFAPGFVAGQCEKVHSGACDAAMFRPSQEYRQMLLDAIEVACEVYGLVWEVLGPMETGEIWVLRHIVDQRFKRLGQMIGEGKENSPGWHQIRADLCGIPNCDEHYHERKEWGKRCD